MYRFECDYSECAHPLILKYLAAHAGEQNCTYCTDIYAEKMTETLRELCKVPDLEIAFLNGGTATNVLAIDAFLRNPFEAAVCASTGHINVHETGAIEYSGHKVIAVPVDTNGKLTPDAILPVLKKHESEHMVIPKLVYVSQSTEMGTIYSKTELTALSEFCHEHGLYLYLDGARLGSALTAPENDLTLADIAALTDAFYIGGTKNGLLQGELLVMLNPAIKDHIRWFIKQRGFMLAKGFVVSMQFDYAFSTGLFFDMAKHANAMAKKIKEAAEKAGYYFYAEPQTNQIFVILPDEYAADVCEKFAVRSETKLDGDKTAVRFVTSWATVEEGVDALCDWFAKHIAKD